MPMRLTTDPRRGLVPFVDEPTAMRDARAYSLRAAARAAFAAYTEALDGGQTPRESIAAALSAWRKFRPHDGDSEAQDKVMSIVLAVLNLDESDRGLLSERTG